MSSKLVDVPPVFDAPAQLEPAPVSHRSVAARLSPIAACFVALAIHHLVPNGQDLPESWLDHRLIWAQPYPIVLESLLMLAVLALTVRALAPAQCSWIDERLPLLAGAVSVLVVCDLITQKFDWMPLPYFPGPGLVFASMVEESGVLFESTLQSLRLLLGGYALGVSAGIGSGLLIGWFPHVRYWGMPVLKLVGPLPATALIPLAMALFGGGLLPAMSLIGFAVWFPVTMLTFSGIASVRLSHLKVARTLGAGQSYLIFRVALPSALPHIFIGLFMGLGASFLTLIVAETVGVKSGLGWYINKERGYMAYPNVYAALLIMSAFFSTLMTLLFTVRDRLLVWQKGVIKW